ncbi:MAG: PAS domain-containing protein [Bacteroidota bacterium]
MDFNANFIRAILDISPVYIGARDLITDDWIFRSGVHGNVDELTGHTLDELDAHMDDEIEFLIHEDDRKKAYDVFEKVKEPNCDKPVELTCRVLKQDGSWMWTRVIHVVYERDEDKRGTKVAVIAEDVSDQVTIERDLKEVVKRLDEISYQNSHEVRAPVASILGLVDLVLMQQNLTRKEEMLFECLYKSVEKLDSIIKEINTLSS